MENKKFYSIIKSKQALRQQHNAAMSNSPMQDVQAFRRNTRMGQPGCHPRTLPPKRIGCAAIGDIQKVEASDTKQGGRACSASSRRRKATREQVYDPLLGRHPIPSVKVPNLLELIADDANILQAAHKVGAEPNKATGIDHKTVRDVCTSLKESPKARRKIGRQILQGKYRPNGIRTVQIPKANGKMRTLGIATVQDRVVQTMILQAVTTQLPKNTWSPYSYAYLPETGVADAIAEVNRIREEGYRYGITLDLRSFFDNVPHDRLIEKIKAHIADKRVVRLVIAFLTPVIVGKHGSRIRNRIGTPQGSVISPWLASMLYMDELDKEITRRGHRFVRYADDVTIFCRTKTAAKRVKAKLIDFIETTMRCPVNREKTKIVPIEHISLLGVTLKKGYWRIQKDKERLTRAVFLSGLRKHAETKNGFYLIKAAQRLRGFLNHYKRIPGMASNSIPSLFRWCARKWETTGCQRPLIRML